MYAPFETFIKINKSEKPKIAKKKKKNNQAKKPQNQKIPKSLCLSLYFPFIRVGKSESSAEESQN